MAFLPQGSLLGWLFAGLFGGGSEGSPVLNGNNAPVLNGNGAQIYTI